MPDSLCVSFNFSFVFLLLHLAACQSPAQESPVRHNWLTHSDLRSRSWDQPTWALQYEVDNPSVALKSSLRQLVDQTRAWRNLQLQNIDSTSADSLARYPAYVLTTLASEYVRTHLQHLPDLRWSNDTLRLEDFQLGSQGEVLLLSTLPNAWNDTLPSHYIIAQDERALEQFVRQQLANGLRIFGWQMWGYELLKSGETVAQGYFNDSTWVLDREIHYELAEAPVLRYVDENVAYYCHDGQSRPGELQAAVATAKQYAKDFLLVDSLPQLQLYGYSSPEQKALRMESMQQADYDARTGAVHLLCTSQFRGLEWGEQYRPWLRAAWGPAKAPILEQAFAMQWTQELRGRPWQHWVRLLAAADALPQPSLLLQQQVYQEQYPVIGRLAMASWIDFVLSTDGREAAKNWYKNGEEGQNWASRYAAWLTYIQDNYGTSATPAEQLSVDDWRGFTLAHEGYSVYNGYGGQRTEQSLRRLDDLGVNAVAIVPYSYLRNPNEPSVIPVANFAGGENDEAVVFAHFSAQQLRQRTLLKPQIWLGSGSWPGDVRFETA
ncbi:MAG: hypothetical protein AAGJ82_01180, partial [Bacteroidota bacterium]